jgi:uncharacterized protein (DUF885 family)
MRITLPALLLLGSSLCALPLQAQVPEPVQPQVPAPVRAVSAATRLERIGERYFEASLRLNPIAGSMLLGEARFDAQLGNDLSPRHRAQDRALQQGLLRELKTLNEAGLPPDPRLSLQLLRLQAQNRLDGMAFPSELMPINQYGGLPVQLAEFAGGQSAQPLLTLKNYQDFLKRLEQLPAWNAQAITNMRSGIARGVVLPRPLIERSLETLQALTDSPVEQHPYYRPILNMPTSFSAAQRKQLSAAYRTAIEQRLQPSVKALADFIRSDYLPNGRSTAGLSALPNGKAWYAHSVRLHTTTALTPEAIHALGLAEVARIRGEMEQLKAQAGFDGPLAEFLARQTLSQETRPFKTEQDVLAAYEVINRQVQAELPKLFKRVPKAALEIRAEPELTRATASDHYAGPTPDGKRPGVFYAVIMDPQQYASTGMSSLFLHEGQPGHHFHIALQQELALPRFRKYDWITAYGEGWALYAETLGHQLGLYQDSNAYLGHLSADLLRAVRLVTDTGLHALGWSREQSIRYMMDTEGVTEQEARRATERYMADPGQALGYKIGALKIRQLRDQAQARLGERFSYADFHEQILSDGALPLGLLEAKMTRWLASQAQ